MAGRLTLVALLLLLSANASGDTLYNLALDDGAALETALAARAVVRFVGTTHALVAGDALLGENLRRGRLTCEEVAGIDGRAPLYICYPAGGPEVLRPYGTALWSEPRGAVLVEPFGGAEDGLRAACFMMYPLPEAVRAERWFDGEPPAHVRTTAERDGRAVRGLVADVMSGISADSLMAHVERLSQHPGGAPRSRYVRRAECLTEARPYVEGQLEAVLPGGAPVDTQRFGILGYTCEQGPSGPIVTYPADNVIGVLEGTGRLGGCYIVCAHYDAISFPGSLRDGYYWWCDNPAPGADDNATGVAVAIEVARALSGVTLPFDVRFALFSGEELGLLGSGQYADAVAAAGDTIYGVLNVDMVAYKRSADHPDTCHIVTNPGSKWLADWILGTVEEHPGAFAGSSVLRIDEALAYSDHASFWRTGYDAVVAIEHAHPTTRNPSYHSVRDTVGNVFPSQLAVVAKAIAGSLARFADPDGQINLAVFQEDVAVNRTALVAGNAVPVTVDVHAFGPSEPVSATVRVWDGAPGSGALLFETAVSRVVGGGEVIRNTFVWQLDESDIGEHVLTVEVVAPGTDELTLTDNEAAVTLYVRAATLRLASHYAYPNPSGAADEITFRYELTREAWTVALTLFDLTGQTLGSYTKRRDVSASDQDNEGVLPGWNAVPWERLNRGGPPLASGVYVYRLQAYGQGQVDPSDVATGKFAVLR